MPKPKTKLVVPSTNNRGIPRIPGNEKLATDPNLIQTIRQDIHKLGLVGEDDAALLVYLTYTSRLLSDPLAIIARGASSSGKTVVLRRVAQLMPPDEVLDAFSLTSASLFNSSDDFLTHKILLCGERKHSTDDQTRDQNSNIRQLLSEKRISRYKSIQVGGNWETILQEREGPVAYAETTTSKTIFEEDLNRCLEVFTNETSAQTRRVMKIVAQRFAQMSSSKVDFQQKAIIDRHREFQAELKTCSIIIPYAGVLAEKMPAGKVKTRRTITQVLAAIEAITLLHQHQRKKAKGYLIATADDYAIARQLLLKPLHDAIGVGEIFRKYKELRIKIKTFTSVECGKALEIQNRQTRKRTLDKLNAIGVIALVRKGTGKKPDTWRWTGKTPDELVLPSVKRVVASLRNLASLSRGVTHEIT